MDKYTDCDNYYEIMRKYLEKLYREKLSPIGGYGVENTYHYHPKDLIENGKHIEREVDYNPIGRKNTCLDNVRIYHKGREIWYGFALLRKGTRWISHYWLMDDDCLIEITPLPNGVTFKEYYGMNVTDDVKP